MKKKSKSSHKIYRKPWFWLIIIVAFFVVVGSTDGGAPKQEATIPSGADLSNDAPIVASQPTADPEETEALDEYSVIDCFISLYNETGSVALSDVSNMDIHGYDYRTEFRLQAFENAVGKKGVLSDNSIQIVNYGVWSNDELRFYGAFSTYDDAVQFIYDVVHILDASISDESIADEFDRFETTGTANIFLGKAGYISGYLQTNYANGGISGYKVFIECTDISNFYD